MSRRLAQGIGAPAPRESREAVTAVIALGSNLGERSATLDSALTAFDALPLTRLIRASDEIETPALRPDGIDHTAPAYRNAVAQISTKLAPTVLLSYLQRIEQEHGRVRHERWGDRTLDLDLIAYGDLIAHDDHLTLPHPRAHERDFVLEPWVSIDPDAVLPGRGRVRDLIDRLGRRDGS